MTDLTADKRDMSNDYAIPCPAVECKAEIGECCRTKNGPLVNDRGETIVHFARRLKRVLMQTR